MTWRELASRIEQRWSGGLIAEWIDKGWLDVYPPELTPAGKRVFRDWKNSGKY